MAQTRLRNYKHDILSFEHNIFNLGMHNPGRYCGFDTMIVPDSSGFPLRFTIGHAGTGISYKTPVDVIEGPLGVLLTPQGDLVMEDAPIGPLNIDTNAGNAEIRYDLVIFNHDHIVSVGGVDGTYAIIRGPFSSPLKPVLVDPLKQIVVGIIELPPNASILQGVCKYIRVKCPDSGDGEDARLLEPNVFQAIQIQKESESVYSSPTVIATFSGVNANLYTLENNGNVFNITTPYISGPNPLDGLRIMGITLQDGARIYLNITENIVVRQTSFFMPTYGPKGFRPFRMNIGMANVAFAGGDNGVGIRPSTGEIWEMECVLNNNEWFIAALGGCGTNSVFKRGMIMLWYGDLNTNFNNDGSGINIMTGWQICNGLHTTEDLRGKIVVGATVGVPALGAPDIPTLDANTQKNYLQGNVYTSAGSTETTIFQANIPNYNLPTHAHESYLPGPNAAAGGGVGSPGSNWASQTLYAGNYASDDSHDYGLWIGSNNPKFTTTSVQQSSGGSGTPLQVLPPVYRSVYIQKV